MYIRIICVYVVAVRVYMWPAAHSVVVGYRVTDSATSECLHGR